MTRRKFTQFVIPNLGAALILLLALTGNLGAQGTASVTPQAATTTISYQGRLTGTDGRPINATLPMAFSLYTTPTGDTAVWDEVRIGNNEVPITDGLFNVLLGSVTPIDTSILNQELWLGISINGDAEMTPREKLGSVPYAARAGIAQTVPNDSLDRSKFIGLTGIEWKVPPYTYWEDGVWSPAENPVWDISRHLQAAGVPADAEMILMGWRPTTLSDISWFETLDRNDQIVGGGVPLGTTLPTYEYSSIGMEYGSPVPVPGSTRKLKYASHGGYYKGTVGQRRFLVIYGWK